MLSNSKGSAELSVNKNRLRVSLRSTFSNCHILCRYMHSLYTRCCTRHNYRTVSLQCRVHHQQTSIQPILLMSTGLYLWSTNINCHQCCGLLLYLLTQIFGDTESVSIGKSDLEGHSQGHW